MPNASSKDWPSYSASLTPFQQQVYAATRRIPKGQTRSYGWVARAIGKPGAARAVGQALNKNVCTDLVPCHRVIAGDGSLGGYNAGSSAKRRRLLAEGARLASVAR